MDIGVEVRKQMEELYERNAKIDPLHPRFMYNLFNSKFYYIIFNIIKCFLINKVVSV